MKEYKLRYKEYKGDIITPVAAYLCLRNLFPDCRLLESADYNSSRNSSSVLVFNKCASITVKNQVVLRQIKGELSTQKIQRSLPVYLSDFLQTTKDAIENESQYPAPVLTGYLSYNAVQYMDSVKLNTQKEDALDIPDVNFGFFEYALVFDHYFHSIKFYHFTHQASKYSTDEIMQRLSIPVDNTMHFATLGNEKVNGKDSSFIHSIEKAIQHCQLGNVFQLVLSRKYTQSYRGDEFAVYRTLRSLNPSPYMFYFDEGDFKLFGSSPECHLRIVDNKVIIHPIAGTIRRSGDELNDAERLNKLIHDPKENAEHDMLIDLARNDLSVFCKNVTVKKQKQIQQFSHVFHLVSEVEGTLKKEADIFNVLSKSFPAGTLSGTPKYKSIELIDELEHHQRNFYGGAIGFIDFNEHLNMAIMIRSVCAKNNELNYLAGAGITINSTPAHELLEVNNKIGAIRKAIELTSLHEN